MTFWVEEDVSDGALEVSEPLAGLIKSKVRCAHYLGPLCRCHGSVLKSEEHL